MLEGLIGGFANCFEPFNLLLLFLGTFLGLLVGALPGLSSPMAIIILLHVTYSLDPLPALLTMIGVYVGTKLGGSFSAILLRTPGTPAGACTALDGFPMAEKGQSALALGYATYSSFFGGATSWIIAVTCIPFISRNLIRFAIFGFFNRFISLNEDRRPNNAIFASRRARFIPAHI